ncbi:superoxide dismutase family protein [Streptomyces sp. MST-110588]|uniref:superoxide dismutase family protein n=1 Tax=Streptomyces sp. MST-110588 TaxID=2833628 RepID=UPI001F5C5B08|nr:superoxide dismutase family protein [Streptomyces sp. MST-110588]
MVVRAASAVAAAGAVMAALASASVPTAAAEGDSHYTARSTTQFSPADGPVLTKAVTYNTKLVPASSQVTVTEEARTESTEVTLEVSGLQPNRAYGAHVHTRPCGRQPAESGTHYQDRKDPKEPSVDPAYANAKNEAWLDFTTDADGKGSAKSSHNWHFRAGEAQSVVIHARRTATGPGEAGEAGKRVACVTVPFGQAGR